MKTDKEPGTQNTDFVKGAVAAILILILTAVTLGVHTARTSASAATEDNSVKAGIAAYDTNDFDLAFKLFKKSAKSDNPKAEYWLGRMYEDGLSVKKDMNSAIEWYRKSAQAGWVQAKVKLGEVYYRGTEELQNFRLAHKWLQDAANDGNARAQRDLGILYAHGWGVKKSPVWAYVWYEIATRQGDFPAQQLRDKLLKTMPDDQIAEAQQLSRKVAPQISDLGSTAPVKAPSPLSNGADGPNASAHQSS